MEYIINTGTAN